LCRRNGNKKNRKNETYFRFGDFFPFSANRMMMILKTVSYIHLNAINESCCHFFLMDEGYYPGWFEQMMSSGIYSNFV
jgi:hypothetical protein